MIDGIIPTEKNTFSDGLENIIKSASLDDINENTIRRSINRGVGFILLRSKSLRSNGGWGGSLGRSTDYFEGRIEEIAETVCTTINFTEAPSIELITRYRHLIEQEAVKSSELTEF